MARQQVVHSECDQCHKSETTPLSDGIKNGNYILPKGWLHIEGNTGNKLVFERDLCVECKEAVLNAAGVADAKARLSVVG